MGSKKGGKKLNQGKRLGSIITLSAKKKKR